MKVGRKVGWEVGRKVRLVDALKVHLIFSNVPLVSDDDKVGMKVKLGCNIGQ